MSSEWEMYQDDDGKPYYYHKATGQYSYEKPASFEINDWVKMWDEDAKKYYYQSQSTGDWQYEVPSNFVDPDTEKPLVEPKQQEIKKPVEQKSPQKSAHDEAKRPEGENICGGCWTEVSQYSSSVTVNKVKYHAECFTCTQCDKSLLGKECIPKNDRIFCKDCFASLFAEICPECGKSVLGPHITALEKSYHKDCFVCHKCKTPITSSHFLSKKNKQGKNHPFCENCYVKLVGACGKCGQIIKGKIVTACDKVWHMNCFTCRQCNCYFFTETGDPIAYFLKDGEPYCEEDFNQLFLERCQYCGGFITDTIARIDDLKFHKNHFICNNCNKDLEGENIYLSDKTLVCASCYNLSPSSYPNPAHISNGSITSLAALPEEKETKSDKKEEEDEMDDEPIVDRPQLKQLKPRAPPGKPVAVKISHQAVEEVNDDFSESMGKPKKVDIYGDYKKPYQEPKKFYQQPQSLQPKQAVTKPVRSGPSNPERVTVDGVDLDSLELFTYDDLKNLNKLPKGVSASIRHLHLFDEEFEFFFQISKIEFQKLPKWKRDNLRKQKNLF